MHLWLRGITFFWRFIISFFHFICLVIDLACVSWFCCGGDYPMSAVVSSEHAGKQHRGFLVLMVFAMQAAGLIVGPFIASVCSYWTCRSNGRGVYFWFRCNSSYFCIHVTP